MQNKFKKSLSGPLVVAVIALGNHFFPELFRQLEQSQQNKPSSSSSSTSSGYSNNGDSGFTTLSKAVSAQRSEVWFDETEFEVVKILSDDLEGSRHQRFLVARNGLPTLLVAHNIDLAPRAPIKERQSVVIRGRYEWNEKGGVIHWTHHDPKGYVDGGWIKVGGRTYE